MTSPHRATPEQWEDLETYAKHGHSTVNCILELRARVEALEQLHQAVVDLNERFTLEPLIARVAALEAAQREHARHLRLDCPVSEEENDRRFKACMTAINAATPEQIQ